MSILRKTAAIAMVLLACGYTCLSQEMPSVVPPAPEAASLGKYTDMPVNYSSGLPQISIPMFTATSRDISVPVSLSYHAGGIRVEEIASRAGLGWNLQAGGSITRSVRGIADDVAHGWLNPKKTVTDFENTPDGLGPNTKTILAEEALAGGNDYEPDIFNFNYPGGSGKFFFDETGNLVHVSASEIKVEYTLGGGQLAGITRFVITDTNGYRYFFGEYGGEHARDITSVVQSFQDDSNAGGIVAPPDRPVNHYSTWYLRAILSPVSDATILFKYTTQNTTTLNRGAQTKMFETEELPNCSLPVSLRTSYMRSVNTEVLLDRILFENGEINFSYDATDREDVSGSKALDKVTLTLKTDVTKMLKTFDLVQGYWTSLDGDPVISPVVGIPVEHLTKRMYLQKVIETGENGVDPKEYLFDYKDDIDMPNRFSYAQDIWGFYNGVNSNTTLIPQHMERGDISPTPIDKFLYVISGADRRPNTEKTKTYSLKSISYPTGGTAHFDYESNGGTYLIGTDIYYANSLFGITEDNLASFHYNNITNSTEIQFVVDDSHIDGTLKFNYDLTGCPSGEDPEGINPCGLAVNLQGVTDPAYLRQLSLKEEAYFNVPNGTYKLTLQIEAPISVTDAHASITGFKNASPYANRDEYMVGGLRLLRTKIDDNFNNDLIKEYSYIENELSNTPANYTPSGKIANQKWSFYDDNVAYCENTLAIATQQTSQNILMAVGTGTGHITYTNVVEAQLPGNALLGPTSSTTFPNGFTVHRYDFAQDVPNLYSDVFPYTPYIEFDWNRGNLIKQSQTENSNGQIHEIQSEEIDIDYENLPGDLLFKKVRALKIDKRGGQYIYKYYDVQAGANHVVKKTSKSYKSNGTVEQSTDFEYNNHYLRADKTITNHSDGQKTISTVKYTDDTFGPELDTSEKGVLTNMVAANIFSPVLSETYAENENTPTGKSLTVFGNETAGYLPVSTKIWNRGTDAFEERLVYSYTNEGNYEHLIKDGVQQIAYIWNYGNTRPTAQVTNAPSANDIAYSSFESTGKGNWAYSGATSNGNNLPSGAKYYDISGGDISKGSLSSNTKYIVSYWAKYGTPTVSNSTALTATPPLTRGGWVYYQHLVSGHSSIQISGSGLIDELRLHPVNSQMSTYTYAPLLGVTSMGSPNNLFTHYTYDEYGRLHMVKDQDGNILKVNEYEYKVPVSTVQN